MSHSAAEAKSGFSAASGGGVHFGWRSALYHWRSSLGVVAAVAVATAVLTGALLVGSSMRQSLRSLALDRLGKTDLLLVGKGFFRAGLADEIARSPSFGERFSTACPAILLPSATAESARPNGSGNTEGRASGVAVWGIGQDFLQLFPPGQATWPVPGDDEVVLSLPLAAELGIDAAAVRSGSAMVTLRFAKPSRLPGDSSLGRRRDLTVSLVRLRVSAIADDRGLGGLTLASSQAGTRNAFVSLASLQLELDEPAVSSASGPDFANVILLAGKEPGLATDSEEFAAIRETLPVRPADLGLGIRPVRLVFQNGGVEETVAAYTALSTVQLVFSDTDSGLLQREFPQALPVSTYLANSLRRKEEAGDVADAGGRPPVVPYSMVSAIGIGPQFSLQAVDGTAIAPPQDGEVVLNRWAAHSLGVTAGGTITMRYFAPESTHGKSVERSVDLRVSGIAELTAPSKPYSMKGRGETVPPVYTAPPTPANDPDLTPHVPGMTDSLSMESWDVPFELSERIRPEDDDYWSHYRTTPKAFLSLETARGLWSSRFGTITGFRIPESVPLEEVESRIVRLWQTGRLDGGLGVVPVLHHNLRASSGSTPFDGLFLGLSLFLIAAALMLVSLLFRLGLEDRIRQIGCLAAVGFSPSRITQLWLGESLLLATAGAIPGSALGVGWAALMVHGLTTWWVAAIGRPFLKLHCDPVAIGVGAVLGILAALATVVWAVRRTSRLPATRMLAGQTVAARPSAAVDMRARWKTGLAWTLLAGSLLLAVAGQRLSGDNQAGAFMGGGFLVLASLLLLLQRALKSGRWRKTDSLAGVGGLALSSLLRNPGRSTLTVALVAVASFLVVAINAFRLAPTAQSSGGIDFVATSAQPLFDDLDTAGGQAGLPGSENPLRRGTRVYSFRVQPGEDASCNNVFQSARPQVLGVPHSWIARFDSSDVPQMRWASHDRIAGDNPWRVLSAGSADDGTSGPADSPDGEGRPVIDAVIDKNTAWYSLKVYTVGSLLPVTFDSGERVTFRVAGLLENSLLQGSLLIGEADFEKHFPAISGYRFFLVDSADAGPGEETGSGGQPAGSGDAEMARLEQSLSDQGFDAQPSGALLERFMSVQNTYLSAFQSLGGLGLLLGTAGLAAVMLRNVSSRRAELAVLRCLGFSPARLAQMVLLEQLWLLGLGLSVGILAALASTFPHWLAGGASIPWSGMALMVAGVAGAGLLTGLTVVRKVAALPVIAGLRSG